MSCSQHFPHNFMDMNSLLGTILGDYTKLQEGLLCPRLRVLSKANVDSSSHEATILAHSGVLSQNL